MVRFPGKTDPGDSYRPTTALPIKWWKFTYERPRRLSKLHRVQHNLEHTDIVCLADPAYIAQLAMSEKVGANFENNHQKEGNIADGAD